MPTTTEPIERLAHIVYELVDILDAEGVAAAETASDCDLDTRVRLTDVKLKLIELVYELTGFVSHA
jgi:hypothetical protein